MSHPLYQQTIEYLYASQPAFHLVGATAYKPGLDNTYRLMAHLGNPHTLLPAVHIAGTKRLKKLFIDQKIPAHRRNRIPVIADDAGVVAIPELNLYRVCEDTPGWRLRIETV